MSDTDPRWPALCFCDKWKHDEHGWPDNGAGKPDFTAEEYAQRAHMSERVNKYGAKVDVDLARWHGISAHSVIPQ